MRQLPRVTRASRPLGAMALSLVWLLSAPGHASPTLQLNPQGSAQVAFTPGDDAAGLVIESVLKANNQILVQAYSFTHQAIADALVSAKSRGVDVQVIADPDQHDRIVTSLIGYLVEQGIPVWLDGEHAAAHDKVMIIDTATPEAVLMTGSFNFTHAAQYRNAENLLVLRGNPQLVELYAANWRRHRAHSIPLRRSAPAKR